MVMKMTRAMKSKIWHAWDGLKPAMVMVVVQIGFVGVNVLYKLAENDGMNQRIIVAYRFLFATVFIAPIAFFIERKSRPKLSWAILGQAFLCGLFGGSLAQNLYLGSMALTSATFTSAMANLGPAVTFILAICFRQERLNIRAVAGIAKVVGTFVGVGGAMFLTFYKGVELNIWSTHFDLLHRNQDSSVGHVAGSSTDSHGHGQVYGALLAVGSCVSYAAWLIVQTKMSEKFPCPFSSSALMCSMGTIQAVSIAICMERDWTQWKLGWNIRLLTVIYGGVIASGVTVALIAWCIRMRGPLFVSIFSPLMLVLVAPAGSLLLDEKLHLGCIVGAVLIVIGLYVVLWGKGKEMKKMTQLTPSESIPNSELKDIVLIPSSDNDDSNNPTAKSCTDPIINENYITRNASSNPDLQASRMMLAH